MPELEDELVKGTGSYQDRGYLQPLEICQKGKVVPRILPRNITQKTWVESCSPVFEIVGTPVDEATLQKIRQENRLSKNYGAVVIPKSLMEKVDPKSTRLIVGEDGENYIVAGLMLTEDLRQEAVRRIASDEEGIVYVPMSEFPTIDPNELMNKWGRFTPVCEYTSSNSN